MAERPAYGRLKSTFVSKKGSTNRQTADYNAAFSTGIWGYNMDSKRLRLAFFTLLALLLSCRGIEQCAADTQAGPTWKAGVARIKITPEEPMWMAGYASRDHIAEGTLTELWAKALVLKDQKGGVGVLVTLDLVGIDRGLSELICKRIQTEHGVTRDQIAICCSHTHTGPVVASNLRPMHYYLLGREQKEQIDDYSVWLADRVVGVVADAFATLQRATLSWGSGKARFAVNRRNNVEDDVDDLRREERLVGPVDHDVPVLAVRDDHERLRAILFGYACHATVLSLYQWSGDYPGFAQIDIEERFPEAVALFWAGCGGDQNPLPRRTVALAESYGKQLGESVAQVINGEMQPVEARLRTSYKEFDLPFDTLPTREQLLSDAASENRYVASRAKMLLEQLDAGTGLEESYPYPIERWSLGEDLQFVFLGGEVVVDYAVRIKNQYRGIATWVAGYSNDVMAYIPSQRVWLEGGYEGERAMIYYGRPTKWSPDVESLIMSEVQALLTAPEQVP